MSQGSAAGRQDSVGGRASASDECVRKEVINFLADPSSHACADRVERFETHGNLVFLAGAEAWKIKRAVRLPYLDFSTLAKRRAACIREVEINHRFGSDLYLGCVPIARAPSGKLIFGAAGEIVEWAVHMRRFEQSALLSTIARETGIPHDLARLLAEVVYEAHERAEPTSPPTGTEPMRRLVNAIAGSLGKSGHFGATVDRLQSRMGHQLDKSASALDERAAHGLVRRCHGDLHLANLVIWQGRPALYDAIEFDEAIATIDTLYDLAFLLMDLEWHGQGPAASIVLNRYLWRSRNDLDLKGLIALPLFLGLRAAVRAMVTADRAAQENREEGASDLEKAHRYVAAALRYLEAPPAELVAIGGLSGTGKTTLGATLAPRLGRSPGAVHLRSDLERKALAGVGEYDHLPDVAYTPDARNRIYEVLRRKARQVLAAGHSVVVDAVFADRDERQKIQALASGAGVAFHGLWLQAGPDTLISRVAARRNDASDAAPETVRAQLNSDSGPLSAAWSVIGAGGTQDQTLASAEAVLDQKFKKICMTIR